MKNTKERGTVEFFVYPEQDSYVGVCLTFGILEEGTNSLTLMESIKEAAMLHLEVVVKNNLPDELLNRHAPKKYWNKYREALKQSSSKAESFFIRSPYQKQVGVTFA